MIPTVSAITLMKVKLRNEILADVHEDTKDMELKVITLLLGSRKVER